MNIIFGIWRPQGAAIDNTDLKHLSQPTQRFAGDGATTRISNAIGMGVQKHYTNDRSRLDQQPASDLTGNLLAYDGRLDNHADLQRELNCDCEILSDTDIILRAYQRWGDDCFRRFVGDWSLSLWDPISRTLYLARDHAGTRTLYYSRDVAGEVTWSTYLDSFLVTHHLQAPDPHYMASYLAMLPQYGHSPYKGVRAVLPGQFIAIREGTLRATQFWTPMVGDQIVYKDDGDYAAHFLYLLEQAIARRDAPGAPRLAQLSGGMDSSTIVCVSDKLRKSRQPGGELIDTLSYFDDSEPSWNERPYFTLVEASRGKSGIHMDVSRYRNTFEKSRTMGALFLYPGIDQAGIQQDTDFRTMTADRGFRSILSGIGGDELTGGIPDPTIALADHFASCRFIEGARSAVAWCVSNRTCLAESIAQSLGILASQLNLSYLDRSWSAIPWLTVATRQRCGEALRELPLATYRPFRSRPSSVDACRTWWFTLRTQPHLKPSEIYRYEFCYPYLDRDLVEFLLRVPQDQLARPGRRRFMMRSALKGIVPDEVLERRRKAYLLGSALKQIGRLAPRFEQLINTSLLVDAGLIERDLFRRALKDTTEGRDLRWWGFILRAIWLETWLRVRAQPNIQPPITKVSVAEMCESITDRVPAP